MKHTEKELVLLKDEVSKMWKLVYSQLEKAKQAYLANDVNVAREVVSREKRVNSFELRIDSDCENFIALYSPVAIDLRLVLSMMKISVTLERIGDFAEGIAKYVIKEANSPELDELKKDLQTETMFNTVIEMLSESFLALDTENTKLAGKILARDETVDEIYSESFNIIANAISNGKITPQQGVRIIPVVRKIERVGDHCSNIVEEIVFYIDAKVLKHSK
ncbi:MAG: phosphate signaling complex protein PhoU [Dysgonamonadaceae bacterium]|jgi:phosphate transport system protein|nr:phosphate signaling complex protein PhoU [Dysgonamonadaceae bacterium]